MTKLKMLAATAILTSLVATPVLAQDAMKTKSSDKTREQTQSKKMKTVKPAKMSRQDGERLNRRSVARADREDLRLDRSDNFFGRQSFNDRDSDDRRGFNDNARYDANGRYAVNGYDGYRRDSGFFPVDVAGGIVGGAIGTAGAIADDAIGTADTIATAPFRTNNSYASYNDANSGDWFAGNQGGYDPVYRYDGNALNYGNYDARNGFLCQPGSLVRGADGRQHLCQ